MHFDIRKTENDYEIHIRNHGQSVTLSEKDMNKLMMLYQKEKQVQAMIAEYEKSGNYHNELFIDFALWDKISDALHDAVAKHKSNIKTAIQETVQLENAIKEMAIQFKNELDEYKIQE